MSFTSGIPASGQTLGGTRQAIQDNFTNYSNLVSTNHYGPNTPSQGKHKYQQNPEQGSAPATAVNEMAMYTKDVAGNSRYFIRQENNGTEVQLTGPNPLIAASGYTFLPGGLLLQWGQETINTKTATINFPIGFTTAFQVIPTQSQADRMIAVTAVTNSNFTVQIEKNSASNNIIRYIAVGTKA